MVAAVSWVVGLSGPACLSALAPRLGSAPQGGPSTLLLFPCPGSGRGLLSWQQDTKWLKHHPSSLIYEVDDWARKHNRDSPSHLQREAPESSNSVYTKGSGSLGPRPAGPESPPCRAQPGDHARASVCPALCRDRGGSVTWEVPSTHPRDLCGPASAPWGTKV